MCARSSKKTIFKAALHDFQLGKLEPVAQLESKFTRIPSGVVSSYVIKPVDSIVPDHRIVGADRINSDTAMIAHRITDEVFTSFLLVVLSRRLQAVQRTSAQRLRYPGSLPAVAMPILREWGDVRKNGGIFFYAWVHHPQIKHLSTAIF